MENDIMWWAYMHTNGAILVKRYFGPEDIIEAIDSPFVHSWAGPWDDVNTREEAIKRAGEMFYGAE